MILYILLGAIVAGVFVYINKIVGKKDEKRKELFDFLCLLEAGDEIRIVDVFSDTYVVVRNIPDLNAVVLRKKSPFDSWGEQHYRDEESFHYSDEIFEDVMYNNLHIIEKTLKK